MDGEAAHKGHHVSKVGAKANKRRRKSLMDLNGVKTLKPLGLPMGDVSSGTSSV